MAISRSSCPVTPHLVPGQTLVVGGTAGTFSQTWPTAPTATNRPASARKIPTRGSAFALDDGQRVLERGRTLDRTIAPAIGYAE